MRMKKIMIIAVAAIALAACSKTFDHNKTEGAAIGFGTWTENLTKARTQGDNTFTAGDDFAVYGFKLNGSTNNVVFDDITVSASGSPLVWDYVTGEVPARYWDPSATSYTFYGVSPSAIGKAADVDPETGEISSASITFKGNDNDILVADKKEVLPAAYGTVVPLVFNHIASLVDFKVDKDVNLGNAVLAITSFSITNIDNTGTFSVNDAYTGTHPVVTWNATSHAGVYDNTKGVVSVTLPTDVASTVGAEFLINNLVVMPQTFRTDSNIQTVNIGYTIKDEANNESTYTQSFNLKIFDWGDDRSQGNNTIIGGWEAGKHYAFILTIDAKKINFSASITPWVKTGNETGYHYLFN